MLDKNHDYGEEKYESEFTHRFNFTKIAKSKQIEDNNGLL